MNILRRNVPAEKSDAKVGGAEGTVHRRIEVTVERETVSVLVRTKLNAKGEEPVSGEGSVSQDASTDCSIRRG